MTIISRSLMGVALGVALVGLSGNGLEAQAGADVQKAVDAAYAKYKNLKEGKNADYIPALAKVDPNLFGIALVTPDGKVYTAGDVKTEVSIQSISKVFTMAQVIQEQGLDAIANRIGVDATGARFNSIIADRRRPHRGRHRRAGDEPARQSRRDLGDQHGEGRDRRRGVEEDHRLPQRRGRPAASPCSRTSTSRSPTPTSATRRSAR